MQQNCKPRLIRCTELAWEIAARLQAEFGCVSVSEVVEWLLLCQEFDEETATVFFRHRKKRGGLGGVHVLPDSATLPPEG